MMIPPETTLNIHLISFEDPIPENIIIDKKSFKDINTYYVGYETINGIKPLYLFSINNRIY